MNDFYFSNSRPFQIFWFPCFGHIPFHINVIWNIVDDVNVYLFAGSYLVFFSPLFRVEIICEFTKIDSLQFVCVSNCKEHQCQYHAWKPEKFGKSWQIVTSTNSNSIKSLHLVSELCQGHTGIVNFPTVRTPLGYYKIGLNSGVLALSRWNI